MLTLLHTGDAHATIEMGISMWHPSPSPAGDQVVFSADLSGPETLWISSLNGSTLRQLTTGADGDRDPAWSPDGQQIAFSRRGAAGTDIWTIRPDGTGLSQVTAKALSNKQPAWSPDGKQLVFVSNRGGTKDLWVTHLDSRLTRRLTMLPGQENHPSFSPDGTQIVFSETVGDSAWLMVVNADGSGLRQLTPPGARDWNPSWSRYGIVFSSDRGGSEHFKIWTVQPNGSGLQRVGDVAALDPVWLPNGHFLFSDELGPGAALATITEFDPVVGSTRVVNDWQGYLVGIDIRPGAAVNRIHPSGKGAVRVAILSNKDFDAPTQVDQKTLTFGRTGSEASVKRCSQRSRDVNGDGLRDLVCRFNLFATGFLVGNTVGILRFKSIDGFPYEGRDSVVITHVEDTEDNDDND